MKIILCLINIDLNFLDEIYREKFAIGKKNEKLLIIK